MAADRMRQVNELLRSELALQIQREVDLPEGVVVSVTKVKTSPDLRNASVLISIVPDNQSGTVLSLLKKRMKHIAGSVAPKLNLRTFPRLRIKIDEQERGAAHIEALLDSLKKTE